MQSSTAVVLFSIFTVILIIVLSLRLSARRRQLAEMDSENQKLRSDRDLAEKKWDAKAEAFEAHIARLAKWETVADAEAKANELRATAEQLLAASKSECAALRARAEQEAEAVLEAAKEMLAAADTESTALRESAQRESEAILSSAGEAALTIASDARQEVRKSREDARFALESATRQAKAIIDAAESKATEIAGSAYEAMGKAVLYEQTVKAMKNIIEGYGDQYMVPERSFLDGLAEDFGHTEAGRELQTARGRSKAMVRNKTAASCEYVEANRHDTAIAFVVDAFNGKVDSILSRVKHDNAGTLEREIQDAFTLVNYNGKAFRNARVSEQYRDARLAELKWAAVAQQLRLDEREEQRRIKEQIREEEKARREFERAIRDAAKEEEVLKKAMEKALQQVQQASAEEKARYEEQLQKLAERLAEAEARSQRALSMAQQTRRGHVYVISNIGSFGEEVFKIGLTRRLEPLDRVRELGDSSVPFEFDVHALIFSEDAPALERQLHKHFVDMQMNKVNYRKEFFRVDLSRIRSETEKLGLVVKWSMVAEAREYRETLAIEKAIKRDPALREAWISRQLELEQLEEHVEEAIESVAE